MKTHIIQLTIVVSLFHGMNSPVFSQSVQDKTQKSETVLPNSPYLSFDYSDGWRPVSFFQVLGNPDRYNNKWITVEGYLHEYFEDCALYFSKDCADRLMGAEALWIHWKTDSNYVAVVKEPLHCKWVSVHGIFHANQHGHMGSFGGTLDSVDRGYELTRWYDGSIEVDSTHH